MANTALIHDDTWNARHGGRTGSKTIDLGSILRSRGIVVSSSTPEARSVPGAPLSGACVFWTKYAESSNRTTGPNQEMNASSMEQCP